MQDVDVIKALANERRIAILAWLKNPRAHFPPQVDGDLHRDGVCAVSLAAKLGISQATLSRHMRLLTQAGLVHATRAGRWTFYRRDEKRLRELKRGLLARL